MPRKSGSSGNSGEDKGYDKSDISFDSAAYYFGFTFEKLTFIFWLFQAAQSCDKKGKLDSVYMLPPHTIAYFRAFS